MPRTTPVSREAAAPANNAKAAAALGRLARHALDALTAQVAIVDQAGRIVAVNQAWRSFARANSPASSPINSPASSPMSGPAPQRDPEPAPEPDPSLAAALTSRVGEGANYLAVCDAVQGEDAALAQAFAARLRDVLAGRIQTAALEYPCHSPTVQRWFVAHIDRFVEKRQPFAIITHENITARREAEQALAASEARYRSLFENSHTVMLIIDPADGALVDVNPAAAAYYGWPREQLRTMHIGDLNILPAAEIAKLIAAARSGRRQHFLLRHHRADGSVRDVESFSGPIVLQGRTLLFSILHDVTERQQALTALRHSQANLAMAQSIAGIGSWERDLRTKEESWSDELYRQLGLIPGEPTPGLAHIFERLHPEDKGKARAAYAAIVATGQPATLELRTDPLHGPPQCFACRVEAVRDEQGAVYKLAGVLFNITAQRRAAEELSTVSERMAQVMRSVPEGVVLLDTERHIVLTNPQAEALLPLLGTQDPAGRLAALAGRPLASLLAPQAGSAWHSLDLDGRSYEAIAAPVEPRPSVPGGWVIVVRDVTDARQVERQLQRQERLAAVGQLAAGIAHDFNNLLSVIMMYAELVADDSSLGERNRARLVTVQQQGQRAAQMIRQILDFSRRSVLEMEPVSLAPLLANQLQLLRRAVPEDIELELVAAPGEYLVKGDPARLEQVVMNLAINARDAMPTGGRLRLELAPLRITGAADAPMPGLAPGAWIELAVHDTGTGIPPAIINHIFEPFFTTKAPGAGTGLGLAQVHGIIAQHGGAITAANDPAGGAVFTIYLPALRVIEAGGTALDAGLPVQRGHGETVLVVEDDDALRLTLAETVEGWGYRARVAANGVEALAVLDAPDAQVDLVLSDVVMPQMGGVSLLNALHERRSPLPLVLMTGHPLGEQLEGLYAIGLFRWLPKPLATYELAQILAEGARHLPGNIGTFIPDV